MASGEEEVGPRDPRLDELRVELAAELDDHADVLAPAALDAMFGGIEGRIREAESKPTRWLRTRSTAARRALAISAFAAVLALVVVATPPPSWSSLTTPSALGALFAFVALAVVSLFVATRPLHVPALPRWQAAGLVALSLAATFVLAAVTAEPIDHGVPLAEHASPCLFLGLFAGVPVFALARMVDRGALLGPLLAASAAGLAGNAALEMHCPLASLSHNVVGHAMVGVIFVAVIGALELALRRRGAVS